MNGLTAPRLRRRTAIATLAAALAVPSIAAAAPATPTLLQVKATGPQQVALTWEPSATEVSGYHVYRNGALVATTDKYTANYFDQGAGLANGSPYSYTVDAFDATGSSAQSTAVSGTANSNAGPLSACNANVLPVAHYKLTADLVSTSGSCLKFAPATPSANSNLSLDCQGHSITQNAVADLMTITNVNGFIVSNCVFQQNQSAKLLVVDQGSYGFLTDNTFEGAVAPDGNGAQARSVRFMASPHAVVGQRSHPNSFSHAWLEFVGTPPAVGTPAEENGSDGQPVIPWVAGSPDSYIGYNTFSQSGPSAFSSIWLHKGDRSVIVHNEIDGGYDINAGNPPYGGASTINNGSDDAIILTMNDRVTVSSNIMSHTWDTAVDSGGTLTNSQLDDNTISHTRLTGFGAYHRPQVVNTKFRRNRIDHSPTAFFFSAGGPTWWLTWLADDTYRMQDNTFSENVLTSPVDDGYPSVEHPNWDFGPQQGVRMSFIPTNVDSPDYPYVAQGNVFKDNDFGLTEAAPMFNPASATNWAASTGNICPASASIQCGTRFLTVSAPTATPATEYLSFTGSPPVYALDYIHWKGVNATDFDRKNVAQKISTWTPLGTGSPFTLSGPTTWTWYGAAGTPNSGSSAVGVAKGGANGRGFKFTIPANNGERLKLRLSVGVRGVSTTGGLKVYFTGQTPIQRTVSSTSSTTIVNKTFEIEGRSETATDTLNVEWYQGGGSANAGAAAILYAAALN